MNIDELGIYLNSINVYNHPDYSKIAQTINNANCVPNYIAFTEKELFWLIASDSQFLEEAFQEFQNRYMVDGKIRLENILFKDDTDNPKQFYARMIAYNRKLIPIRTFAELQELKKELNAK